MTKKDSYWLTLKRERRDRHESRLTRYQRPKFGCKYHMLQLKAELDFAERIGK